MQHRAAVALVLALTQGKRADVPQAKTMVVPNNRSIVVLLRVMYRAHSAGYRLRCWRAMLEGVEYDFVLGTASQNWLTQLRRLRKEVINVRMSGRHF